MTTNSALPFTADPTYEISVLYEISSKLNHASSESEWLEAVSLYARQRGAKGGYLLWIASESHVIPIKAEIGASWILDDAPHVTVGERLSLPRFWKDTDGWITSLDEPVFIEDIHASPILSDTMKDYYAAINTRSIALLPQVVKGRWVSLLGFHWREPMRFGELDRRIFASTMRQSSAVIETMRLTQRERLRAQRAEQISAINMALSRARDENEILNALAQYAAEYGAKSTVLSYVDRNPTGDPISLTYVATHGVRPDWIQIGQCRIFTDIDYRLLMPENSPAINPIYFEDLRTDERLDDDYRSVFLSTGIQASVALPLLNAGVWQGMFVIYWLEPHQFTESERRVYRAIIPTAAAVVARRRVYLAEQEAREEVTALYQVSQSINQANNIHQILSAIKNLYPDPMEVTIFNWENHNRSGANYLEAAVSTDSGLPPGARLPNAKQWGAATLDSGDITVINDVNAPEWEHEMSAHSAKSFGILSIAYTNLAQHERVLGLLAIGSKTRHDFTQREIRLMSAVADLTAAALERFRAHQAEQEAYHEREQLFRASQALNAVNSYQGVLQAVNHIDFDDGDFYLYVFENYDSQNASFIETVASGNGRFMDTGTRIPMDQVPFLKQNPRPGLWAYEDIPNNAELDPVTAATMINHGVISNLRFGLVWHNRNLGAFGIDHAYPKHYNTRERRMMTALGEMISAAVERIRLQDETLRARERAERLAAQSQQFAALEERTKLARELHDSVSQALYGIGLGAQTARRSLDKNIEQTRESIEYVLALTEAGLTEMRALIFELRPESLETEGVVVALAKQSASLQARHGIVVRLDLCDEPTLSLPVKESLYRVAREALHNVVKHANATEVALTVAYEENSLRIEISDNGDGFDPDQEYPGHLGLHSMRERIAQIGGELSIWSAPNQGARLTAVIPFQSNTPED